MLKFLRFFVVFGVAMCFLGCTSQKLIKELPKHPSSRMVAQMNGKDVSLIGVLRIAGNEPFAEPVVTLRGVDLFILPKNTRMKEALFRLQGKSLEFAGQLVVKRLVTRNKKVTRFRYELKAESVVQAP
ncbi:MAG: hypothetical protein ACI9BD_000912 [Candidatus Marinamargulisbacteria bacterium]